MARTREHFLLGDRPYASLPEYREKTSADALARARAMPPQEILAAIAESGCAAAAALSVEQIGHSNPWRLVAYALAINLALALLRLVWHSRPCDLQVRRTARCFRRDTGSAHSSR